MRKFIALLLAVVMTFGVSGSAVAGDCPAIDDLIASGNASNSEVYSLWVDFADLSNATVGMTVYNDGSNIPTSTTTFSTSQVYDWTFAEQQLNKYTLGNIANLYKDKFNTKITSVTRYPDFSPRNTIPIYVYGEYKAAAIAELYSGIPTCFDIVYYPPDTGGGGGYSGSVSQPVDPIETPVADAVEKGNTSEVMTAIFSVGTKTIKTSSGTSTTVIEMDVPPYVENDRTYVPVRYLAYSLGVPDEGVTWEQNTKTVGIFKDEADITLTIGSTVMLVNQEPIQMDVAPEITNGRAMLPARWVAEALGAEVEWDESGQQAIIKMPVTKPGN